MEIRKVAVIGGGAKGSQIAMQVAISGFPTRCYSRSEKTIGAALDFAMSWVKKCIEKGKMTEEEANAALARIEYTTDLVDAVKDVDIVIEAVGDMLGAKREIFAVIDELTPEHTIFASTSAYIISSKFADSVSCPEKVLNLLFFDPALAEELVEVIKGPHSSE